MLGADQPTPAPDVLAVVERIEALQMRESSHQHCDADNYLEYVDALTEAFPALASALRAQHAEIERLRRYMKLIDDIGNSEETCNIASETAISMAQTLARQALAPATEEKR